MGRESLSETVTLLMCRGTNLVAFGQDEQVELRVEIPFCCDLLDQSEDVGRQLRFSCKHLEHLEHKLIAALGEVAQEIEDAGMLEAERADERHVELLDRATNGRCHFAILLEESARERERLSACGDFRLMARMTTYGRSSVVSLTQRARSSSTFCVTPSKVAGGSKLPATAPSRTCAQRAGGSDAGVGCHIRLAVSVDCPDGRIIAIRVGRRGRRLGVSRESSKKRQRKVPNDVAEIRDVRHPLLHGRDGRIAEPLVCKREGVSINSIVV
jgi:hypothetical protein